MSDADSGRHREEASRTCARQTLALLPILRRFVTSRVQDAGADLGLSLRQFAALRGIQEGASSPGELARLWRVTPAVITGIVDRLESRRLVRREPDPADRRRLRLELTEEGHRVSDGIEAVLTGALAGQLAAASAEELAALGRALTLLQGAFSALEGQTSAGGPPCAEDDMPNWEDEEGGGSAAVDCTGAGWTGDRH